MKRLRQKLMRRILVNEQEVQACREELHLCLEQVFLKLSGEELTLLEIAINEAINNAMKYGSAQASDPAVTLSICLPSPKCLLVRVKDRGSGFSAQPALKALSSKDSEKDEEWQWGESGRGLFIMERVMDQVRYNAKGNVVLMLKSIR